MSPVWKTKMIRNAVLRIKDIVVLVRDTYSSLCPKQDSGNVLRTTWQRGLSCSQGRWRSSSQSRKNEHLLLFFQLQLRIEAGGEGSKERLVP
jgi:hypothetical protein